MRSRDAGLLLVAALAAGGFFLLRFGLRGPASGPEPASLAASDRPGATDPDQAAPLDAAPLARASERSSVAPPPAEPSPADPAPAEREPPAGIVVSGSVRFADDDSPAAGVRFLLRCAAITLDVRADDQGRFRTEARATPGIVAVEHRPGDGLAGSYPAHLRFTPASFSLQGEPGDEVELDLRLERPQGLLPVRVVHVGGRPAPGARVELQLRHELHPGELASRFTPATTDAEGRVRFALYDLELLRAAGLIARIAPPDGARDSAGRVSAYLLLDPATWRSARPAEVELVIDAAASLLVHTRDEAGADVPFERLWLDPGDALLTRALAQVAQTDAAGRALFAGLPAGTFTVHRGTGPGDDPLRVELGPGERAEVELVVPLQAERLAVAGLVVDEAGAPLAGVSIRAHYGPREGPGDTSATVATDAEGRFELRAAPCAGITLRSDEDIFGDEFTPPLVEVPFGATDVLFTRVRSFPRQEIELEIVDRATSERLDDVLIMTYRAPNLGEYSFHRAVGGLASPLCALHPGTTLVVELAGYRRATLLLADLLAQEPVDGLRRIALDRGLLRRLRVEGFDAAGEQSAIPGARIRLGERVLGTTDARGEVELDLFHWPESGLTVEAAGFHPALWEPADGFADVTPAYVWLERE